MHCRHCGKDNRLTTEELRESSLRAIAKRRAEGRFVGRPAKIDYQEIRRLRAQGLSYNKIAKAVGTSASMVHYWLVKSKTK